jgi:hypothetical protein
MRKILTNAVPKVNYTRFSSENQRAVASLSLDTHFDKSLIASELKPLISQFVEQKMSGFSWLPYNIYLEKFFVFCLRRRYSSNWHFES